MSQSRCTCHPLEPRQLLASVQGFLFNDIQSDPSGIAGLRDSTIDLGVPNIQVDLFTPGPNGRIGGGDDQVLQSTFTNNNGFYIFQNLAAAPYIIRFRLRDRAPEFRILPKDLSPDVRNQPDNSVDSDVDSIGRTPVFQLRANDTGEQSMGVVSVNAPGKIIATFKGIHGGNDTFNNTQVNVGFVQTGQLVRRTVRWYNVGGKPITIRKATGGIERFNQNDPSTERTGRFWEFLTNLNGVTFEPGHSRDVKIRYGTDVTGGFGNKGSFVVGRRTFVGPINVTANDVTGIGGTIREKLAQPRRGRTDYRFPAFFASTPANLRPESLDRDILVIGKRNGNEVFRARARRVPLPFQNAAAPCVDASKANDAIGEELNFAADNCEATYRIPAPGGRWDTSDNGMTLEFRLLDREVFNFPRMSAPGRLMRTLRVSVAAPAAKRPASPSQSSPNVPSPFAPTSILSELDPDPHLLS